MQGVRLSVAHGRDADQVVYEADSQISGRQLTTTVQRASFLHELLAEISGERMHTSKKLVRYEHAEDRGLVLHFADGTVHECEYASSSRPWLTGFFC